MSDKYGAIDPITGMEMGFNPLGTPKEPKPCPKCKKLQAENKDLKERIELAVYYLPESPDKALSFLKPATEKKSSISTMEEYERNAYRGEIGRFEKRVEQLQAELDKAKFVIGEFENWYSDNGCPLSETKEGFCPCIDELKKEHNKEMDGLDEEEKVEFDPQESCDHSDMCGWCYVRYYEKLFEDKQALKGGEK